MATVAAVVAVATLETEACAPLDDVVALLAVASSELAIKGVAAVAANRADEAKIWLAPAPIVRSEFAGIADAPVKMSVPAETVVPPV